MERDRKLRLNDNNSEEWRCFNPIWAHSQDTCLSTKPCFLSPVSKRAQIDGAVTTVRPSRGFLGQYCSDYVAVIVWKSSHSVSVLLILETLTELLVCMCVCFVCVLVPVVRRLCSCVHVHFCLCVFMCGYKLGWICKIFLCACNKP